MDKFILSGFADEICDSFEEQLAYLNKLAIPCVEVRGVDGKNVSSLTEEEAYAAKQKLDAAGITVSAIGSPIGKIGIDDDFDAHIKVFRNTLKVAGILGTKRIRIFSFYIPSGEDYKAYKTPVMERLRALLAIADEEGYILCHENEKGIYGDSPEGCLDIMKEFGGCIRCVFDHANFINGGFEPFPYAYEMLKDYIDYMHIKDAKPDGIYPAGMGDGRIKETLELIKSQPKFTGILSIEPHLTVFTGLKDLESKEKSIVVNKYASKPEAFTAAADAIKGILAEL